MPTITLSATTYRRLQKHKRGGAEWVSTGKRRRDGKWRVPISKTTWDRLQQLREPGDSNETVVLRALAALDEREKTNEDPSGPSAA